MLLRILLLTTVLFLPAANHAGDVSSPPQSEIDRLGLDPFYRKYLGMDGFPIVSSKKVSDFAFREAAFVIGKMLENRPDIRDALIGEKVRLAIMATDEFTTDIPEHRHLQPKAYWDKRARGLGSSKDHPAVSVGEENLLRYRGDPYIEESILVHEFAHAMHQQGLNIIDPGFQTKLEQAFNRASLEGLWKGKYAGTNPAEYWAEGVQSWFDTNREDDFDHNHVDTRDELREHDPLLAALVESVFGDGDWRYRPPSERAEQEHLSGFNQDSAPVFAWSEEMMKAFQDYQDGGHLLKVHLRKMEDLPAQPRSPQTRKAVQIRFKNRTADTLSFSWIGFDGKRTRYGVADPGREFQQNTFEGHLWVISDQSGKSVVWCTTPSSDALAIVE